jgi:hypothetical protein
METRYLDAMLERIMPRADEMFGGDAAEGGMALVVAQAVRDLCWGSMQYRCKSCKYEWAVWMALGVEGPDTLKECRLYVPSPFIITCPTWPNMEPCRGEMSHVDWGSDCIFYAPKVPPDDVPRFVLPDSGGTCGRLYMPTAAIVRARRALNEPA